MHTLSSAPLSAASRANEKEDAWMPVSFDLTEDQIELQKWVHEFAANVVRPAASEYDEREDFPWPVL